LVALDSPGLGCLSKVVISDKSGREVKVNTYPDPYPSSTPDSYLRVEADERVELIRERTAVRHLDHPWIFLHNRTASLSYRLPNFTVSKPQPHCHHEHSVRHLAPRPSRDLTWNPSSSAQKLAPSTSTTIPGNTMATLLLGSARESLDEQLRDFSPRHDGYVDARIFLGPRRGR
jgi:hypothetical protein